MTLSINENQNGEQIDQTFQLFRAKLIQLKAIESNFESIIYGCRAFFSGAQMETQFQKFGTCW